MSRKIIALAGYRSTGKSKISDFLCEKRGFKSVHPFGVWKIGLKAMYEAIGIPPGEAEEMVYGSLKDTPHKELPNGHDSRFLMEKLGNFTGTELGPDWTLRLALKEMDRLYPEDDLVIESIVYEADIIRDFGGHIVMVERPGTGDFTLETDRATQFIAPDSRFLNDGQDLSVLHADFDQHMARHGLHRSPDTELMIS